MAVDICPNNMPDPVYKNNASCVLHTTCAVCVCTCQLCSVCVHVCYLCVHDMLTVYLCLCTRHTGQNVYEINGYGTAQRKKNPIISKLISDSRAPHQQRRGAGGAGGGGGLLISGPEDFRRVSAIIDVDIVPETHRRVKLMKNGSDKPLGFYIRDGTSVRLHANGVEKVPGIFISRLVPGGLAESTGLLAVNDEVLEVNGIEVVGKTLDQVTDMMVANSSNLIITVKPVNQRNNISPKRGGSGRQSQKSTTSLHSTQSSVPSHDSDDIREYDEHDEVKDYTSAAAATNAAAASAAVATSSANHTSNNTTTAATAAPSNVTAAALQQTAADVGKTANLSTSTSNQSLRSSKNSLVRASNGSSATSGSQHARAQSGGGDSSIAGDNMSASNSKLDAASAGRASPIVTF